LLKWAITSGRVAVKTPGELTLAHFAKYVDEVVTDEGIARAVLSSVPSRSSSRPERRGWLRC
jgi:hypothetical protein